MKSGRRRAATSSPRDATAVRSEGDRPRDVSADLRQISAVFLMARVGDIRTAEHLASHGLRGVSSAPSTPDR